MVLGRAKMLRGLDRMICNGAGGPARRSFGRGADGAGQVWPILPVMGRIHLEATVFADPDDDRTLALRRQRFAPKSIIAISGALLLLLGAAGAMQRVMTAGQEFTPLATYVERAEAEGRPLLFFFTGDECAACRRMDEEVFADPARRAELARRYVIVPVHRKAPYFDDLARKLDVASFPTIVVTTSSFAPVADRGGVVLRHTGYLDPRMLRQLLERPTNTRRFRTSGGETISHRSQPG